MSPRKASVRKHTSLPTPQNVPKPSAEVHSTAQEAIRVAGAHARALKEQLASVSDEQRHAWMQACVAGFAPFRGAWTLEICFYLAFQGPVRFSKLQALLGGLSSRTLTDKLAELQAAGFVEKRITVDANRPLITYALTREGVEIARIGGPFMTFLNPYAGLR